VKSLLSRIWRTDEGVLTFEWILLITIIVIGVVGGVSVVRDALVSELGDVTGAAVNIDQSYFVVTDPCTGMGAQFYFEDTVPECIGAGERPEEPVVSQGSPQSACED
jgi:Flp pilus assembly pilin Flp